MVLVSEALASLVETHRAHSCAGGKGHCSDSGVGGEQVLGEYRGMGVCGVAGALEWYSGRAKGLCRLFLESISRFTGGGGFEAVYW